MTISKWHIALAAAASCAVLAAPIAEASTYVVQPGDSLYKIAQKYNISITDLQTWNKLTNTTVLVNQTLVVAQPNSTPTVVNPPNQTSNTTITPTSTTTKLKTYRVVKGDTLSKIATRHNTTVAKIKDWNSLSSDLIKIGQVLIVQKNTTLSSIALKPTGSGTASNGSNNGNGGTSTGGGATTGGSLTPIGSGSGSTTATETSNTEATAVDKMIQTQLASEKTITTNPSSQSIKQYNKLIEVAKSFIGVPYVFGGNTPAGFDCSGFISYVFNEAGIKNTRRTSLDYFLKDTTTVKNPVPGDIVFFKNTYIPTISHMGIYLGNGEMIHAGSKGIEITKLSYAYWSDRQVAIKRFNNVK